MIYDDAKEKIRVRNHCVRKKPYAVNPDTDTPVMENPQQLSTNRTSTETINKREKKEIQHRYGSYENVLLSDTEYGKLRQEFPGDYQMRVERLSEYMASTGRSYKITLPQSGVGRREKSRSITRQTTHLRKETAYERHGA